MKLIETVEKIKACDLCGDDLQLGPRPVVQVHAKAKILISGQAPGIKVHRSGVPFDDASGERLRLWMGIDRTTFYDPLQIEIVTMGVPSAGAAALAFQSEVLAPEDGNKRNAGFDHTSGHDQTGSVNGAAIALQSPGGLLF